MESLFGVFSDTFLMCRKFVLLLEVKKSDGIEPPPQYILHSVITRSNNMPIESSRL